VSRRKLSLKDYEALNRARFGARYPPGGGPAELRTFGAKDAKGRRRKRPDEGDWNGGLARACAGVRDKTSARAPHRWALENMHVDVHKS
jgi:hypothetical protein